MIQSKDDSHLHSHEKICSSNGNGILSKLNSEDTIQNYNGGANSNNIKNPLIHSRNEITEQNSKLFNSGRSVNEESINLKLAQGKEDLRSSSAGVSPKKKSFNGKEVVYLTNEVEAEKVQFPRGSKNTVNQSNLPVARRETYLYNNLNIKVRGFNYKNTDVFDETALGAFSTKSTRRRYTKLNIDKGKNFFKLRYIKEKFEELMNLNNKGLMKDIKHEEKEKKKGDNYNFKKNNNDNQINKFQIENNIHISPSNTNLNLILNEDKNAIKFNSLFLQKLEKGIFSFNLKKYEDSYNYLLDSGIVKDEHEFGELLLVITGFDKYIVGDFMSKEKPPNTKEKKVLRGFMNSMDFRGVKFLEAFRFLLSRLNLPKDASLILEIIDVFSLVFFEDNKDSGHFKDSTSVYLLSSSVLALNTMFSRTDIVNMKVFKKEQFVKMNTDVNRAVLENIYDDLKFNKMDITYDYNEVVYKRVSLEVKSVKDFFATEEAFNKVQKEKLFKDSIKDSKDLKDSVAAGALIQNQNNNFHSNVNNHLSDSTSILNEMKGEEIISMLKNGEVFTKYGKHGDPHPRMVKLSEDEKRIMWFTLGSCSLFKKTKFIEVSDIKDVYIGVSSSKNFERFKIPPDYDSNCFSITTISRSLDLRKDDENICKKWFHAIRFLLKRTKSLGELKNKSNLKDFINKKEIVSDIWKTEILPNWHIYRKFVIVKGKGTLNAIDGYGNANVFFSAQKEVTRKKKEKFWKILIRSSKSNTEKILDDKDKSEFLFLWTLGLPQWLRKKIWYLVIGNESGVSENLFNHHLKLVENVNFEELLKLAGCNNINKNSNFNYPFPLKLKARLHVSEDPILNEIINDVLKISLKYFNEIRDENLEFETFVQDLFKVVRVFTLFRPDITYSKQITYISTIILLNSENYYSAFVSLANFSISSFVMKFLTRDEIYVRNKK
jgi:hypothetical protein